MVVIKCNGKTLRKGTNILIGKKLDWFWDYRGISKGLEGKIQKINNEQVIVKWRNGTFTDFDFDDFKKYVKRGSIKIISKTHAH